MNRWRSSTTSTTPPANNNAYGGGSGDDASSGKKRAPGPWYTFGLDLDEQYEPFGPGIPLSVPIVIVIYSMLLCILCALGL